MCEKPKKYPRDQDWNFFFRFKRKKPPKYVFCVFLKQFMMERNLSNVLFVVLFHFEGNKPLKCAFCGFLKQFMMERNLSNICLRFFTANLLKRVLWNSAQSHLLHTITLAICGFRNLRYFAQSQNQQIEVFYCIYYRNMKSYFKSL